MKKKNDRSKKINQTVKEKINKKSKLDTNKITETSDDTVLEQNIDEDIINPFKKYEYVEPKKKFPIKNILLCFFIVIAIILIIIFLKIIDNKSSKMNTENQNTTTQKKIIITMNSTTSSTNKIEDITETLVCNSINNENNIETEVQITANFHNKKLRSDVNYMRITLLDEAARDEFDKSVSVLQMFSIYLSENTEYEIIDSIDTNEFIISIKTDYNSGKDIESNLKYDEDYESVKQKLIALGHECK